MSINYTQTGKYTPFDHRIWTSHCQVWVSHIPPCVYNDIGYIGLRFTKHVFLQLIIFGFYLIVLSIIYRIYWQRIVDDFSWERHKPTTRFFFNLGHIFFFFFFSNFGFGYTPLAKRLQQIIKLYKSIAIQGKSKSRVKNCKFDPKKKKKKPCNAKSLFFSLSLSLN